MNANKGVFGVNLGHMWGEVDRMIWVNQLTTLWEQSAIKPKIARTFPLVWERKRHPWTIASGEQQI
jgi:hypothetical protein